MTLADDIWKVTLPPGRVLRVILRDDSPLLHCGDGPSYRTVTVKLTDDQIAALALKPVSYSNGKMMHEQISRVLIEEE